MEELSYSVELTEATRQFLDKMGVEYTFEEEKGIFRFSMVLGEDRKMHSMDFFIRIHEDAISSYVIANVRADADSMNAVVEYAMRANCKLRFGNFEVDYNNGEVRYKCYNRFEDRIPSEPELAYIAVGCGLMTWEYYEKSFLKVLFGGANPKDALEEMEQE